jgi:hypothetical protein
LQLPREGFSYLWGAGFASDIPIRSFVNDAAEAHCSNAQRARLYKSHKASSWLYEAEGRTVEAATFSGQLGNLHESYNHLWEINPAPEQKTLSS